MTANLQLMRDAKSALRGGKWGTAALATLIYIVILGAASSCFGIGGIIVGGPMTIGYINFLKAMKAGNNPKYESLFEGFQDFLRSFLAYLLVSVFIFLWTLLLVIPGIIMSFAYSMTMYIIADDPEITAIDAIRRSREMMHGYKWKLFCLWLRFFGWWILCCLTFGILIFWVQPYITMATLNFYEDVKADWLSRQNPASKETKE